MLSTGEAWELPAWKSSLSARWRECYLLGKPGNCLPGRAHSLPVKECYLPGKPGNCLLGRAHSVPVKECYLPGKHGICLPGSYHSLLMKECYLPGKPGRCLPGRAHSLPVRECYLPGRSGNCLPGRNGSGEELFLPGKAEGKPWELSYLSACYLPREGPSSWGNLRALPSYTSFLPSSLGSTTLLLIII